MRFRPRYTIRTFLILVGVLGIWLGWHVARAQKQRAAVNTVRDLGGAVYYQYQWRRAGDKISFPAGSRVNPDGSSATWSSGTLLISNERESYLFDEMAPNPSPVPTWIRSQIGDDMFVKVVAVHLEDTQATDDTASHLAGLPYLRVLNLSRTEITDEGLVQLSRLKRLEKLTLDGTAIEGMGLVHLQHSPRLEELSLSDSRVTDVGLASTRAPVGLKSITLDDTDISDAGLTYLRPAAKLVTVSLSGTRVRGPGLRHLQGAEVQTLRLARTPLEDADLSLLARWAQLRSLSLKRSTLTDAGLDSLKGLTSLKELQLPWVAHRMTNISAEAAREIEAALPNTKVTYPW